MRTESKPSRKKTQELHESTQKFTSGSLSTGYDFLAADGNLRSFPINLVFSLAHLCY